MSNPNEITDRDLNLIRSVADWLQSRSRTVAFNSEKDATAQLMVGYAEDLRDLKRRLEPLAVERPVTMDELFGNQPKPRKG